MIKPAVLYSAELQGMYRELYYTKEMEFYTGWIGSGDLIIPDDDSGDARHFAIVDKNDNVIGYACYAIDWYGRKAENFGAINLTGQPSYIFAKGILEMIHDIFTKYNLRKMCWQTIGGNPIEKAYNRFCLQHGGRIVGRYEDHVRFSDGSYHDSIMYELTRKNYLESLMLKNKTGELLS